ncbi:hypothetical protein [Leptospira fainei]|nr:hypothetical protein [Leptospira fainei]
MEKTKIFNLAAVAARVLRLTESISAEPNAKASVANSKVIEEKVSFPN